MKTVSRNAGWLAAALLACLVAASVVFGPQTAFAAATEIQGETTISSDLAISDGSPYVVKDGGTLTIDGATITCNSGSTPFVVESGGALVVKNGAEIKNTKNGAKTIEVQSGGSLEMDGAKLTLAGTDQAGIDVYTSNEVVIKDATLSGLSANSQNAYVVRANEGSTVTFTGSTKVQGNTNTTYQSAGGIVVANNATINVEDGVAFSDNNGGGWYYTAAYKAGGAAIWAYNDSVVNIEGASFTNNTVVTTASSYAAGGAVAVWDSQLNISNSTFSNNTAQYGGGAVVATDSQVVIDGGSTFTGNRVTGIYLAYYGGYLSGVGGAVYVEHGRTTTAADSCTLSIDGATFTGNEANDSGGAISISGNNAYWDSDSWPFEKSSRYAVGAVSATITAAVIEENTVSNSSDDTGGGGIYIGDGAVVHFSNLLVTGNTAEGVGGGIYSCATSSAVQFETAGSAVYGNTGKLGDILLADKDGASGLNSDLDYTQHEIKDFMLGGGNHNWTIEEVPNLYRDYALDDYLNAEGKYTGASYTANPTGADKAETYATVIIRNNTSKATTLFGGDASGGVDGDGGYYIGAGNGGGITNNGLMTIDGTVGELQVKKTVVGEGAPSDDEFSFTVALSSTTVEGDANPDFADADDGGAYGVTFVDGKASFTLKAGETKTIANLPPHADYTVVEGDCITQGYTTSSGTIEGTVPLADNAADQAVEFVNTYEVVDIDVAKTWDDADDQDGIRPKSITVSLLADGEAVEGKTLVLDEANSWTGSFAGLPKYARDESGKLVEIAYTVEEEAVAGYDAAIEGHAITNTHVPGTVSVEVEKAWDDADDADGLRPASVVVRLLADGAETGQELVLSERNSWRGSFNNLPEKAAGKAIAYTVAEDPVPEYESPLITGDAANGFVVTNKHVPEEPKVGLASAGFALVAYKRLAGSGIYIHEKEFCFQLLDADGQVVDSAYAASGSATGTASFADLYFDEPGTYVYTIREVLESTVENGGSHYAAGVRYDEHVCTLTIVVEANEAGDALVATGTYSDGDQAAFTNEYNEEWVDYDGNRTHVNDYRKSEDEVNPQPQSQEDTTPSSSQQSVTPRATTQTTLKSKGTVNTSDRANPGVFAGLAALAALTLATALLARRRRA